MMQFFDNFLGQFLAIFAIMDPLGVSAIMLSLLPNGTTDKDIKQIAFKSTSTIIIAFFVVLLSGNFVLWLFRIQIDSLKVIGGLILLFTAIKMIEGSLKPKNQTPEEAKEAKEHEDISVIPLGIPITFGPGIFATIIIFKAQAHSVLDYVSLVVAFMLVALITYLIFRYSIYIRKAMGITGQKIIGRLMGLVVGAIAVQFIISGIAVLWMQYIIK
ncbi:MAG: MarC family protein [Campylobacteraceae bacterium]